MHVQGSSRGLVGWLHLELVSQGSCRCLTLGAGVPSGFPIQRRASSCNPAVCRLSLVFDG